VRGGSLRAAADRGIRAPACAIVATVVASERYERDVRRALKDLRDSGEAERLARVKPIFLTYIGHVPVALREELWEWYADRHVEGDPRFGDVMGLAVHLSGIIDIYDRAYDERRSPLDEDEWDLVHSLTNEGSPDMPMDTLEYVMQILMDRGRLG